MTGFRFTLPPGGDVPAKVAARRLGITESEFNTRKPELFARGFPEPDETTGQYDLDAIDEKGLSILHYAASNRSSQAVPIVILLLKFGANPNFQAKKGILPLHNAANNPSIYANEIIEALANKALCRRELGDTKEADKIVKKINEIKEKKSKS